MAERNILISSAGRRHYLVGWFREAVALAHSDARVIAADCNPHAPALVAADRSVLLPLVTSPDYPRELERTLVEQQVGMAISLNDFEISMWRSTSADLLATHDITLPGVPAAKHASIEDKLQLTDLVVGGGVRVPETVLASDIIDGGAFPVDLGRGFIVKNRYGSGSSGLVRSTRDTLLDDVRVAVQRATSPLGDLLADVAARAQAVVVQPCIPGVEFGIDVVNDLDGNFAGALARRKLRMRSGETDQATTVVSDQFDRLATALSGALGHTGLVDIDVIVDDDGHQWLLDVNPRFGGGYPFCHVAGADVPSCYLAWQAGRAHEPSWLLPQPGVTSAKSEAIHIVAPSVG